MNGSLNEWERPVSLNYAKLDSFLHEYDVLAVLKPFANAYTSMQLSSMLDLGRFKNIVTVNADISTFRHVPDIPLIKQEGGSSYIDDTLFIHEYLLDPLLSKFDVIIFDNIQSAWSELSLALLRELFRSAPPKDKKLIVCVDTPYQLSALKELFENQAILINLCEQTLTKIVSCHCPKKDIVSLAIDACITINSKTPLDKDIVLYLPDIEKFKRIIASDKNAAELRKSLYFTECLDDDEKQLQQSLRRIYLSSDDVVKNKSVCYVIDSGYMSHDYHDLKQNCINSCTVPISKGIAWQRAKTATLACYRLYDESSPAFSYLSFSNFVHELLILKQSGHENPLKLKYLYDKPPTREAIETAIQSLVNIDVMDFTGRLKEPKATIISGLGINPLYTNLVFEALSQGCADLMLKIVSILSVYDDESRLRKRRNEPFVPLIKKLDTRFSTEHGDHIYLAELMGAAMKTTSSSFSSLHDTVDKTLVSAACRMMAHMYLYFRIEKDYPNKNDYPSKNKQINSIKFLFSKTYRSSTVLRKLKDVENTTFYFSNYKGDAFDLSKNSVLKGEMPPIAVFTHAFKNSIYLITKLETL